MAKTSAEASSNRLLSLDAYRGFTMALLISGGLGLASLKDDPAWGKIADQFTHRTWEGCTFWDLIQPSFMFIVGVAMVFSYAQRLGQGQGWPRQMLHALKRAALLCLVGIFLDCYSEQKIFLQFIRVLQQIAIGYLIAFLVLPLGVKAQLVLTLAILVGHTAAYVIYGHTTGSPPWDQTLNVGHQIDLFLQNHFGIKASTQNYAAFNALGSTATILIGVLVGELLRASMDPARRVMILLFTGGALLGLGWLLSGGGGWFGQPFTPMVPMIKRLWTSSFTLFAAGWTIWMFAGFYLLIDAAGWKMWSFPFLVVGANSIAAYVMAGVFRPTAMQIVNLIVPAPKKADTTRLVSFLPWIDFTNLQWHFGVDLNGWKFTDVLAQALVFALFWLVLYWFYRRKIFFKL